MSDASPEGCPEPETFRDGRYAVTGRLGEGGQGETLLAVDKQRGCLVAVKRFRIRGARSWKDVELAEREARVLLTLDHPSLPRYVDHFEEAGCLLLVTELIEGTPLSEIRRRGTPMTEVDVVRLLEQCRGTLGYLHHRAPPIIHRDIKPSNVIWRPDGSFALVDFGSVRDCLKPEGGSTVTGTFGFMAPEQLQGRALPATDIYSLGATAVCLLSGRDPDQLPHEGLRIRVEQVLGSHVNPALVRALSSMVEPDPDRRPAEVPILGAAARPGSVYPPPPGGPWPPQAPPPPGGPWPPQAAPPRPAAWHGPGRAWPGGHGWGPRPWGPLHVQRPWGRRGPRRSIARSLPVPLVMALVLVGLLAARIVTFATLRVAVPVVLVVLSLVFGSALRRAAATVRRAGRQANGSLRELGRRVQSGEAPAPRDERTPSVEGVGAQPRHRVPEPPGAASSVDEQEAPQAERSGGESHRRTRRTR